jgi:ribosomal protein S18 acetylase RimI-like enzyme
MPEFPDLDHWLPQVPQQPRRAAPPLTLRHPAEADFGALEARLREWAEDRGGRRGPGRAWLRHFGGTGWLAEEDRTGRPLGVLLGFRSADRPAEAVVQLVAVDPEFRRRGIGRELVERFTEQLAATGATRVVATCRPDDRIALAFFGALGFAPDEGPGSTHLYGVPAYEDWDGSGEDRVLLERSIAPR